MSSPGIRPRNNKPAAGPGRQAGLAADVARAVGGRRRAGRGAEHCHAPGEDGTLGTAGRRRLAVRAAASAGNRNAIDSAVPIAASQAHAAPSGRPNRAHAAHDLPTRISPA